MADSATGLDQRLLNDKMASSGNWSDLSASEADSSSLGHGKENKYNQTPQRSQIQSSADTSAYDLTQLQCSLDEILQKALSDFEQRLESIVDKQIQRFQQNCNAMSGKGDHINTKQD